MNLSRRVNMEISASNMLHEIANASGYTQTELANALGTTQPTINSWINNKSLPRKSALAKIEILYFEHVGVSEIDREILDNKVAQAQKLSFPLKRLLDESTGLFDELIVQFTYNTNSIEGSTMSLEDTHKVVIDGEIPTNKTLVELTETQNHKAALIWLVNKLKQGTIKFDHDLLCELHIWLMNGIRSDAGQYRTHPVRIKNSRTVTANHASIEKKLNELFEQLNRKTNKNEIVGRLAKTHALFEQIHPFGDGNGRAGRLLMFASAIQAGAMAPLVKRSKRGAYYSYLEQAQTKEKYDGLEYFIATSMFDMDDILK
jgi:Fic family protein/DNA-binding XRE family transcriptional regulator